MWIFTLLVTIVGGALFPSAPALGEMTIVDVALAAEVQARDPLGRLEPSPICVQQGQEQTSMPVFNSAGADALYLWNRVQVASSGVLRHTWYVKRDDSWSESAAIDLPVRESSGYRTWSSKKISSDLHRGEWKVEMSDLTEPDKVLCTAKFRVD